MKLLIIKNKKYIMNLVKAVIQKILRQKVIHALNINYVKEEVILIMFWIVFISTNINVKQLK